MQPDRIELNRGYKISIASDHAGIELKSHIISMLKNRGTIGHDVVDLGPYTTERVDYPDYAAKVCASVLDNSVDRGIVIHFI